MDIALPGRRRFKLKKGKFFEVARVKLQAFDNFVKRTFEAEQNMWNKLFRFEDAKFHDFYVKHSQVIDRTIRIAENKGVRYTALGLVSLLTGTVVFTPEAYASTGDVDTVDVGSVEVSAGESSVDASAGTSDDSSASSAEEASESLSALSTEGASESSGSSSEVAEVEDEAAASDQSSSDDSSAVEDEEASENVQGVEGTSDDASASLDSDENEAEAESTSGTATDDNTDENEEESENSKSIDFSNEEGCGEDTVDAGDEYCVTISCDKDITDSTTTGVVITDEDGTQYVVCTPDQTLNWTTLYNLFENLVDEGKISSNPLKEDSTATYQVLQGGTEDGRTYQTILGDITVTRNSDGTYSFTGVASENLNVIGGTVKVNEREAVENINADNAGKAYDHGDTPTDNEEKKDDEPSDNEEKDDEPVDNEEKQDEEVPVDNEEKQDEETPVEVEQEVPVVNQGQASNTSDDTYTETSKLAKTGDPVVMAAIAVGGGAATAGGAALYAKHKNNEAQFDTNLNEEFDPDYDAELEAKIAAAKHVRPAEEPSDYNNPIYEGLSNGAVDLSEVIPEVVTTTRKK